MLSPAEADAVARALDLDVDALPICHLCLLLVVHALETGREPKIRGAVRRLAPQLWDEGLEQPVRLALARARDRGVPSAGATLADAQAGGGRSRTVQAIVRRLAEDMLQRIAAFSRAAGNGS